MKLTRNRDYLFLLFSLILIIVFVILAITLTLGEIGTITPTQAPSTNTSSTSPRIEYEKGSLGKSLVKLTTRIPLSTSDIAAKERLADIASANKGLIYSTNNYSIEYIRAMDDIEVEILTVNIDQAKNEAIQYLNNQGLSDLGVCNLPVRFYLSYVITKELPDKTIFNPLPPGC